MRTNGIAVIALSVGLAVAAGCHNKRVPIAPLPAAAPPVPAPAPVPAPPEPAPAPTVVVATIPPSLVALDQADRAFNAGSYDEAARGYQTFLRIAPPGSEQTDRALFQLGLTYVLRPAPATDWASAATTFKQLQDEHPNSHLRAQANLILSLRTEVDQVGADLRQREQRIKQLTTELDRLKKIDADRRKRP